MCLFDKCYGLQMRMPVYRSKPMASEVKSTRMRRGMALNFNINVFNETFVLSDEVQVELRIRLVSQMAIQCLEFVADSVANSY
jgi:hypothetical protein